MARKLEIATLEQAARDYAAMWLQPDRKSRSGKVFIAGPGRVLQDFYSASFKDEFEFLVNGDAGIKAWLGGKALADFEKRGKEVFKPRSDKVFAETLKRKLAIDPDGNHIEGAIGTVQVGVRPIAVRMFEVETKESVRRRRESGQKIHVPGRTDRQTIMIPRLYHWPVYAGEAEERAANSRAVDELPEDALPTTPDGRLPADLGAAIVNISIEAAQAGLDAMLARLDEGSTAASLRGRTGTMPVDPDASETGTLLFTCVMSDPAFPASADDGPDALATASPITDDSSADATGTLTYGRLGATGTGADDHFDLNAGTSDAAFILNTVSIVSGAVVSVTSITARLPQGPTAT